MARSAKAAQRHLADILFPLRGDRSEDDEGILSVPLNERRLQTETYDFTIVTIDRLLKDKKIIIPEFQRKYVWTRNQASRLIESLIIQCPIPVVYFDQEADGTLKVIDGNQRLMSIKLFMENAFKLQGLKAFSDLNGLSFRELDSRFRTHIENRTLRCITILKETHPQIKFDVFERLNTGAVQLNPQELRHGLYYGKLMDQLDALGEYEPWQTLSGFRDDKRMRGAELILRFLALSTRLDSYEKPLAAFLNNFAQDQRNSGNYKQYESSFKDTVDGINSLLGGKAFRTLDETGEPDANFNSAVFDAQMVGFSRAKRVIANIDEAKKSEFFQGYLQLQEDKDYVRAISASTSDPPLVRGRINAFRTLIEKVFVA